LRGEILSNLSDHIHSRISAAHLHLQEKAQVMRDQLATDQHEALQHRTEAQTLRTLVERLAPGSLQAGELPSVFDGRKTVLDVGAHGESVAAAQHLARGDVLA
jgi:hypothetical protein